MRRKFRVFEVHPDVLTPLELSGIGLSALFGILDRGQRRVVSASLKEVIEGLVLKKPLPVAALYRQVVKFSQERGELPPSYGTVFNNVRNLPADLVTLAHEGTKAYSNTFELVHRREADRPNAVWQASPAITNCRRFVRAIYADSLPSTIVR